MKKIMPVLIMLIIVSIVGFFIIEKMNSQSINTKNGGLIPPTNNVNNRKQGEGRSIIGSIKEAMTLNKQMRCTYNLDVAGQSNSFSVIVDGKKFKSETLSNGITVYGLYDGTTQYSWMNNRNEGTRIDKTCLDSLKDAFVQYQPENQPNSVQQQDMQTMFDTAKNVQCQPISNVDFSVPNNIQFVDQCDTIKQSIEMMKKYKGNQ